MSTQKNLITLCFAAVFTLGLAACGGGGGGGEPPPGMPDTVEPMDNSADEAEILRLMGELETAMDNSADEAEILRLMGELETAMDNSADDAEILRLTGELETAMDNSADEAEILRLMGELETAMDNSADDAEILRLTGELETAMDNSADDAEILRLTGELETAMDNSADDAEILRLMGELETAMDNSADDAEILRLMGELETAMDNSADEAEILRLMGELETAMDNSADDAEILRLTGELETAMDNSEDDAEILRLTGELETAMDNSADDAEILRLMGELETAMDNSADEAEIASLMGELETAISAGSADDAEILRLMGELATAMDNSADEAEIAKLMGELATAMDNSADEAEIAKLKVELATAMDNSADEAEIAKLKVELATLMMRPDTTPAQVQALRDVAAGFASAQNARDDANAAAAAAKTAAEDAMEYVGKLTTLMVAGDSATATTNAQKVLDAQTIASDSVDLADSAVTNANAALTNAEALDSGTPNRASLISALKAAVTEAEAQAKAAADSHGGDEGAIARAVGMVRGDNEEMPMSAADHGEVVAMDIAMALVPASDADGGGMRVMHTNDGTAMVPDDAVTMNDHQGDTWEEIVTASGTMVIDARIAAIGGAGTTAAKAASIAGMAAAEVVPNLTPAGEDGMYADGFQTGDSDYEGIPGIAFCGGNDCSVDEDGDLVGSWYFTPTASDQWYVRNADDSGYDVELMYARFGHWLADSNDDGDTEIPEILTDARSIGNTEGLSLTVVDGNDDLSDTSATFSGAAAGMSVEKTTDSDGNITDIASGAFTAKVTLKATFGAEPADRTLGGTINGFKGPATDPNWTVELQTRGFDDGNFENAEGTTVATGRDGEWTAQAYGPDGGRPVGIFGGFNAHFSDGHAAGAYATRK